MNYGLLIARQRSGTGAVGTVLDKHSGLKYLGEVFHPANLGQDHNYFSRFLEEVGVSPETALPDARYDVFIRFLETLSERYGSNRRLIVDVKYNSLHHLDGGWRDPLRVPHLIQCARAAEAPILHLTRRNAVASFVSLQLAKANDVWHAREDSVLKTTSLAVNIRELSDYVVMIERETALIEEWLDSYPRALSFDYSEAFAPDGSMEPDLCARLQEVLGVAAFEKTAPVFKKQSPAILELAIENFALVKRAFDGTPYKWMLE